MPAKPVGVLVRTAAAMRAVLAAIRSRIRRRTGWWRSSSTTPPVTRWRMRSIGATSASRWSRREIYVDYRDADGMRDAKPQIPAAKTGTARNMEHGGSQIGGHGGRLAGTCGHVDSMPGRSSG